ncbi:MAG: amidase family protein, partial [Porticoccaceae bacterium]|nr:amidase family protein [Porticoccaceae bacterium]
VTTAGSKAVAQGAEPAKKDAVIVDRLRQAGAILLGHTNMTELAYSGLGINPHYGTPLNGWERHRGHVPGGSSSGAAISVAENMAVAAIGSDTGGSVRIPSAFNRLYGFKPTLGRHNMDGVFPLGRSLDTVGPLARSVECCRILDHVMAGLPVPEAGIRPMASLRFGILETIALDGLDV